MKRSVLYVRHYSTPYYFAKKHVQCGKTMKQVLIYTPDIKKALRFKLKQ